MEQYNAEVRDPQVTEIPRQPNARERALHEVTPDPEDAALRERPTVQADFFFCEERSEDTKYISC